MNKIKRNMASGSAPRIGFTMPSSASSPAKRCRAIDFSSTSPAAARHASAMGRSNAVPSLRMSAGARFAVIRFCGRS